MDATHNADADDATHDSINDALAAVLQDVRTPGDFYASGQCPLHMPQIEVDGVGPIALPLLPVQAEQLKAVAELAPYGRGGETLVDTSVRKTWQLGADRVRVTGKHWTTMMDSVVQQAATGLGAGPGVVAELYKLLVYDEGSFFVSHRDTEKSAGMFATLIVALPSLHTGGELQVRHGGREVQLDLRSADLSELAWAAFYADCVHEVLPITSGCRLVLVFNLLRLDSGRLPRPPSYDAQIERLGQLLRAWSLKETPGRPQVSLTPSGDMTQGVMSGGSPSALPAKLVYPLEHAYTPAELSFAALKGADAAAATVLTAAARDAACDLHVALMRIEESGSAEYGDAPDWRSSRYGRYRAAEEDFVVGEVFDRSLTLSDWSRPDAAAVSLGAMPFLDEEVCPSDAVADMEPDEQHFEEATGNEGASFERSYQRAALVLWPQAQKLSMLAEAGLAVSLPALDSWVSAWMEAGAASDAPAWRDAQTLATHVVACWPVHSAGAGLEGRSAEETMLSHLLRLQDLDLIDAMLSKVVAAGRYTTKDNAGVVQALRMLAPSRAGTLLHSVVQGNRELHIGGCANLLARAAGVSGWRGRLQDAANALLAAMPGDPSRPKTPADNWRREHFDATAVYDTLCALAEHDDLAALADNAVTHWLAWPQTFGLDAVIVPALCRVAQRPALMAAPACQRLKAAACAHLQARVALELVPPANWQREAKLTCGCEHCGSLGRFLINAEEKTWRFKARESDRRHVEEAIQRSQADVTHSTERKGSPHVLVCIKNDASFQRRVKQRKADLDHLQQLDG